MGTYIRSPATLKGNPAFMFDGSLGSPRSTANPVLYLTTNL